MGRFVDKDVGAKGTEPHVYAMGEIAFKHVKRSRAAFALIMSGDSGAGKTETTKHLMRYLAWRSETLRCTAPPSSSSRLLPSSGDVSLPLRLSHLPHLPRRPPDPTLLWGSPSQQEGGIGRQAPQACRCHPLDQPDPRGLRQRENRAQQQLESVRQDDAAAL